MDGVGETGTGPERFTWAIVHCYETVVRLLIVVKIASRNSRKVPKNFMWGSGHSSPNRARRLNWEVLPGMIFVGLSLAGQTLQMSCHRHVAVYLPRFAHRSGLK